MRDAVLIEAICFQDQEKLGVQLSSMPQVRPASAEKPTRQWAAWTRQEEQSFFNALRLEGKVRRIDVMMLRCFLQSDQCVR
jgi:hypothetical protein